MRAYDRRLGRDRGMAQVGTWTRWSAFGGLALSGALGAAFWQMTPGHATQAAPVPASGRQTTGSGDSSAGTGTGSTGSGNGSAGRSGATGPGSGATSAPATHRARHRTSTGLRAPVQAPQPPPQPPQQTSLPPITSGGS